jgi:hypothetical protein
MAGNMNSIIEKTILTGAFIACPLATSAKKACLNEKVRNMCSIAFLETMAQKSAVLLK